jgi:hypothetical protein
VTRHHASGAMVRQCGLLATKHAVPAAAMSLRDTMGPVRDTARMLQLGEDTALLAMSFPQMCTGIALTKIIKQGDDVARAHRLGDRVDPLHIGAGGLTDKKAGCG